MTASLEAPRVAILVVNWNKKNDLLNLMEALKRLDYENREIVVVDNASTDGSVEALRGGYPEVSIIENRKNLGGTGGFNTGLNHILQKHKGRYKYVWLLDNDALVDPVALKELVRTAESDPSIGLAGSKIMNPRDPGMIVELGADIDWKRGVVRPLMKNTPDRDGLEDLYDVDYVAVCSALVRVSALERVGVMDERYFIFWDDMDWGVTFRRNGYRVVAVNRSVVYHPAFTEKGPLSPAMTYYAFRNPLLMFSKHAASTKRISSLSHRGRRAIKKIFFFWATGRPHTMKVMMLSIVDFFRNRWGQFSYHLEKPVDEGGDIVDISASRRFIVIPPADKALLDRTIGKIRREAPRSHIALLVPKDRASLFADAEVEEIIVRDDRHALSDRIKTFLLLLFRRFDIGVVSPERTFAYTAHTIKDTCIFDVERDLFRRDRSRGPLWKLAISFIAGEAVSYLLLPAILLCSLRYRVRIEKGEQPHSAAKPQGPG